MAPPGGAVRLGVMLKTQRALGLLLVALGGAVEASRLDWGVPPLDMISQALVLPAHGLAAFGAALYALTMTGRWVDALPALLPIPVLAPAAAVVMAWRRGDLSRAAPAPRRVIGGGEAFGLMLGLAALSFGASSLRASYSEPPSLAYRWTARPSPAPAPAPVSSPADVQAAVSYEVAFIGGTSELTAQSRSVLGRVADTMHYYPLDDLLLSAPSPTVGDDDVALAQARLISVKHALIEEGLRPDRLHSRVQTGALAGTVDLFIIPN